jgi:hypothetical protein
MNKAASFMMGEGKTLRLFEDQKNFLPVKLDSASSVAVMVGSWRSSFSRPDSGLFLFVPERHAAP